MSPVAEIPGLHRDAEKDARIEHGRAVAAQTRLELAIPCLQIARAEVSVTLGEQHDTTKAVSEALLKLRVAKARLDIAVRWLARTP